MVILTGTPLQTTKTKLQNNWCSLCEDTSRQINLLSSAARGYRHPKEKNCFDGCDWSLIVYGNLRYCHIQGHLELIGLSIRVSVATPLGFRHVPFLNDEDFGELLSIRSLANSHSFNQLLTLFFPRDLIFLSVGELSRQIEFINHKSTGLPRDCYLLWDMVSQRFWQMCAGQMLQSWSVVALD